MKVSKMGQVGELFYVIACVLTLGGVWISKLIIQKAIVDAFANRD